MDPSFIRKHSLLLTFAVVFVLSTAGLAVRLFFFPEFGWKLYLVTYLFSFVYAPAIFYLLRWINRRMDGLMPYDRWGLKRLFIQNVLFVIAGCLLAKGIHTLLFMLRDTALINDVARNLLFSKLGSIFTYSSYTIIFSLINLAFYTAYLFGKWQLALEEKSRLEITAAGLEREAARMQYENLKNQLNPHFLFNSFTSLNSLISKDPALAQRFLQQLSKVYRHLLRSGEAGLVSLQQETDFVTNYIALQLTRFGRGLQVSVNVPPACMERKIVPVTLQVLVENAIKHNIIDADSPLRVSIHVADGALEVSNNIQLKNNVEFSNRQGLRNLHELYAYYTKEPLLVSNDHIFFKVKVPLL